MFAKLLLKSRIQIQDGIDRDIANLHSCVVEAIHGEAESLGHREGSARHKLKITEGIECFRVGKFLGGHHISHAGVKIPPFRNVYGSISMNEEGTVAAAVSPSHEKSFRVIGI